MIIKVYASNTHKFQDTIVLEYMGELKSLLVLSFMDCHFCCGFNNKFYDIIAKIMILLDIGDLIGIRWSNLQACEYHV